MEFSDLPIGWEIGAGGYSTVYSHATDPSKVVMVGVLRDDSLKLALYAQLGKLESLACLPQGQYGAILTRMRVADWQDPEATDLIDDSYRKLERIRDRYWGDYDSAITVLMDWGTEPDAPPEYTAITQFLVDVCDGRVVIDNKWNNWLVDPASGLPLPMDVFMTFKGFGVIDSSLADALISTYVH